MPYKDPERRKAYNRDYQRNRLQRSPDGLRTRREANERARNRMRKIVREEKDVPCADCGEKYPHYVMDFDHRDPKEKVETVGRLMTWANEARLREEIAKCEVVCANCHRERSFGPDGADSPEDVEAVA